MASVISFTVNVSVSATDANGNTVQLTSGSPMVDFARFNGLQTLIDMNDVPVGTYSNVSITLSNGTIGYLDTSTTEPTIQTMTANLSPAMRELHARESDDRGPVGRTGRSAYGLRSAQVDWGKRRPDQRQRHSHLHRERGEQQRQRRLY